MDLSLLYQLVREGARGITGRARRPERKIVTTGWVRGLVRKNRGEEKETGKTTTVKGGKER